MMLPLSRFNIILALLLLVTGGCSSTEEKKKRSEAAFLRFHLETNADGTRHNGPALVYRANPIRLNIEKNAILDEGFMKKAELVTVDEFGSYAIKITFDDTGTQRFNDLTAMYKGRRLVLEASWTESRFLGAPLITKHITNGVFIFTPDASREESERIVAGLNNVIADLKKPYLF